MDEYIKVSGKTVEDAILEASIQLGTTSDNIDYRVIEAGSKGFLGIGAKRAVIEAKVKKTDEEFVDELLGKASDASNKKSQKKDKEKASKAKENPEKEKASKDKDPKESREGKEIKEAKDVKEAKEVKEVKEAKDVKEAKEVKEVKEAKEAKEKKEDKKKAEKADKAEKKASRPAKDSKKESKKESGDVKTAEQPSSETDNGEEVVKAPKELPDPKVVMERAEKFLKDVFGAMNQEVQIRQTWEEDSLQIDLEGEGMGVLIGKRGQTLDSLQYLVSLVVNQGNAAYVRVKLDTENYRERRKATLENLAKNIAFKVKKTRKPVYLEPMNPYERRIIHSALQNDPFVTTHSEGEEPCRKVVVTMKKRDRLPYRDMENEEE